MSHLLDVIPYALPFAQVHIHMAKMIYFFFPFFFFGFLLTVLPCLLSVPALTARSHTTMFLCFFAAALLFSFGLSAGEEWIRAGVGLVVISNIWLAAGLLCMLLRSGYTHKQIPVLMWVGVAFACPGSLALTVYVWDGSYFWGTAAEAIGIYGFLFPTTYTVVYRMVPIFTAISGRDVVCDRFGLHLMLTFSLARMVLMVMDFIHGTGWLISGFLL